MILYFIAGIAVGAVVFTIPSVVMMSITYDKERQWCMAYLAHMEREVETLLRESAPRP